MRSRSESGIQAPDLGDVPARKPTTQLTIAELQNELMVARMQLDEFVARSASMHSNDPYRVGDDKIARDRDVLVADVRQWSRNFNRSPRGVLRTLSAGDEPERPFEKALSEYEHYLTRHPRGTSPLVRGFVWMKLVDEVFQRSVWMGGYCIADHNRETIYAAYTNLTSASTT